MSASERGLARWLRLADRLQRGEVAEADVHRAADADPDAQRLDVADALRRRSAACVWYAPARALALARVAQALLPAPPPDPTLLAASALTLAVALNQLGRFAEATPLLQSAQDEFRRSGRPAEALRCATELLLADTYLARFDAAQATLDALRPALAALDRPEAQAYADRAAGLFHLEQTRYGEAVPCLQRAADAFAALGLVGEAALTASCVAEPLRFMDPQAALAWLDRAMSVQPPERPEIHTARCDHIRALVYDELNQYARSLALYERVCSAFAQEGMEFLRARCEMNRGIAQHRLGQDTLALAAFEQARRSFLAQALPSHAAACDINLAGSLYALNRYAEALALYERLAQDALAEGRALRAARCHANMGLCYLRLGRYDQALLFQHRAYEAFHAASPVYGALLQMDLGWTLRQLGRYADALDRYEQARAALTERGLSVDVARCDARRADLYLALGDSSQALACLQQAQSTYATLGHAALEAVCQREMARVLATQGQGGPALALAAEARQVFAARGLLVDGALCDIVSGEAYLAQGDHRSAAPLFSAALATLEHRFPDNAWAALRGLGECARRAGDDRAALAHWLAAVDLANQTRSTLPTERLSGGLFADRRALYDSPLQLALALGETDAALTVVEASKAQTFLGWTARPGWRTRSAAATALGPWLGQEADLRVRLDRLRRELCVLQPEATGLTLRGEDSVLPTQAAALEELARLAREYEDVVERLRIAAPGIGLRHQPFSAAAFRAVAEAHVPGHWASLAYYLVDDRLILFYLDRDHLTAHVHPLTPYDRVALRYCTDLSHEHREMVYHGTLRGHPVPNALGPTFLAHLSRVLLPPTLPPLEALDLLIIAPHGPLHALPFHALPVGGQPLGAQTPLIYAPSLSALQWLMTSRASTGQRAGSAIGQALVCALAEFGGEARPLPHAADEVAALRSVLDDRAHVLWGDAATRAALLDLSQSGQLADYDVLHFATHAVFDAQAPSQSRLRLADGELTVADLLELRLAPSLVVLSACDSGVGQPQPGDEVMGLAHALFFSGARAVVASQWPIEDAAAHTLMHAFYRRLDAGVTAEKALQATLREMVQAGYTPYQWAPFRVIGLP